jgi:hypothetical protein
MANATVISLLTGVEGLLMIAVGDAATTLLDPDWGHAR